MKTLVAIMIIIFLTGTLSAEEITLKKTFFSDWKYSTDGQKFKGVGLSGTSLRELMADNDEAVAEMNVYKSRKVWMAVLGWPGGFMAGWACGAAIAGNWKDSDGVLLGVGVSMMVVSAIFEASATRHLKKAVSIYNGDDQELVFDMNFGRSVSSGNGQVGLALTYSF